MAADFSTTHFELFSLPPSFAIDQSLLDSRYRDLQRTVHPDRYVNATDQERRLSLQQAARINEGYRTLKDPLMRGRYLLELAGYRFDEERHTTSDPEFLLEQMELREELGDVREASEPFAALAQVMDRVRADLQGLTGQLQQQLAGTDKGSLEDAADTLMKMQFFRRLEEEASELEVELEDGLA